MSTPLESSKKAACPDLKFPTKSAHFINILRRFFAVVRLMFRWRQATAPSPAPVPTSSPWSFGASHTHPETTYGVILKHIQDAKRCGVGGFGTVLVLEHPTEGTVALKHLQTSPGQCVDDLRRRTLREADTWQELKHPHVLSFLGVFETPTDLYLISPFLKNGSLDAYLHRHPNADRKIFLQETAGAVAYLHHRGIVHGDIKASNILVSDDVHVLLCDFGLARSEAAVTSVGLEGVGTIRFQSPELLDQGGGKTLASDAWAFGMTIYQVLSGNIPYYTYNTTNAILAIMKDEHPPKSPDQSPLGASYDEIWNVAGYCWKRDPLQRISMEAAHTSLGLGQRVLKGHTSGVNCLAFSPDGTTIVSGSADHTLQLWDVESGVRQGEALHGHKDQVYCAAFSRDGTTIVSGSKDHTLRLWSAESRRKMGGALTGHTGFVYGATFSPDGRTVVSGSTDCTFRLWNAGTGRHRGEAMEGHTNQVYAVAFSPDGTTVVSVSLDSTIRLWDVETQKSKAVICHTGPVRCVALSPDGRTIASGHNDCTIRLWDVESGSLRPQTLRGHTDQIWSLVFSSDSKVILSGSDDHTVRLWNAESGNQRGGALKGHTGKVWAVAFSPDGKTVASGSLDHTLRLWSI